MRPEGLFVIVATVTLALCNPGSANAQIYKCEGADGVVEYSNSPPAPKSGRSCRTIEVGPITVIPAPKPAVRPPPPATPGSRPGEGFPKVDSATQRARDDDRRRILQDELGKEEGRLAELRKEYNNGEPERQGNERNYQKYLDRVQRLKDDIERAEANVGTIRKELSAIKP